MAIETGLTEQLRTLHRQSRHEEVIAGLEGKPIDDNPELHLLLGLAYFMSSDQQRGLEMIKRALETEPANSAWRSDAALAKMLTGEVGTAAAWLEEVVADNAPAAVDFGRLAAVRLSQGLQDSAVEAYREAIHREPGREHWHHNLASVYVRMGKLEQALEHYDAALNVVPEFDRSVIGRRTLLAALDKGEELVEELEAQLASDADNIGYRVQLARALDQDNRLSEAIRCLGHSVKPVQEILDTEDADPDDMKGETAAGGNAEQESPSDLVTEQITLRLVQAELFNKHSRYGLALRRWDEVAELTKEENPGIVCARSNALVELGRYE